MSARVPATPHGSGAQDDAPSGEYAQTSKQYRDVVQAPFSGYHKAARPPEDTELTHVGPGTPCGEYFRRFWIPVAMTQEVTDLPLRVRILGEDLVLFRSKTGGYGLLHLHCSHRNASLEFGVVEERGIRCCYHGWLYGVDGTILEQPAQQTGGRSPKICHGAYPTQEYLGLVFAYMGPPEEQPDFPRYDTTTLPDVEMVPYSIHYPCNWLQIAENTMDPWHTVFLHARVTDIHFGDTWGIAPLTEFYTRDDQVYSTLTYRIDDTIWVRSQETLYPSFSQVGAWWETGREEKYFKRASITKWTIPHDDQNCMIIAWRSFGEGIDPQQFGNREEVGKNSVDFPGQTGVEPYEYRQRHPNDFEAQVSQGPINPHAAENLSFTDKGVAYLRRKIRSAIRSIQEGKPLPQPTRVGDEWLTHVQDTVLPIPPRSDMDDEQLLREVCDAVMDVVFRGDDLGGQERRDFIESELKKLKHEERFFEDGKGADKS